MKQRASRFKQNEKPENIQEFVNLQPLNGLVAQWIEQQPSKLRVVGSNPTGVTYKLIYKPVNQ